MPDDTTAPATFAGMSQDSIWDKVKADTKGGIIGVIWRLEPSNATDDLRVSTLPRYIVEWSTEAALGTISTLQSWRCDSQH